MAKHLEKEIKEELLENKPKARWEYEKTLLLDTLLQEFKENMNIADTFLNFDCLYILGNGYSYLKS